MVELRDNSAGSNGLRGGASIIAAENYPHKPTQTGTKAIVIPESTVGGTQQSAASRSEDRRRFEQLKKTLEDRMERTPELRNLKPHARFTETKEGLRIDLVEEADLAMFALVTDRLLPADARLLAPVPADNGGVPTR